MYNPRFPHTCKIVRYSDEGPMIDQLNVGDPMEDEEVVVTTLEPTPQAKETTIYEGICRSFNRDTTADNGDVNASYRYLALPQKQSEWTERNIPREGDKVFVQRHGYTEYGMVIDIRPGNLGTHILWKYVRN